MSDDTRSWLSRTVGLGQQRADQQAPGAEPDGEDGAYKPFGHGHPESAMLEIRMTPEAGRKIRSELLPLHHLMRASCDIGTHGDHVTLQFADCLVVITGRHLDGLQTALVGGKVGFVEEYDARRWGPRPDGKPVIVKIEVLVPDRPGRDRG